MPIRNLSDLRQWAGAAWKDASDEDLVSVYAKQANMPLVEVANAVGYDAGTGGQTAKRLTSAFSNYAAGMQGVGEAITGAMGLTGAEEYLAGKRRANEVQAQVASGRAQKMGATESYKDVDTIGEGFNYAGGLAVGSLPYALEAVTGGIGARALMGGTRLALTEARAALEAAETARDAGAIAQATQAVNQAQRSLNAGSMAGGAAASYPSAVGDILQNQREQTGGQTDIGAAGLLGVPYVALGSLGVGGALAKGSLFRNTINFLDRPGGVSGALLRTGATATSTGLKEGASETGQEMLNQAGRMAVDDKAQFFSEEAIDRYKESFVGGAVLGGALGGGLGGYRRSEGYQAGGDIQQAFTQPQTSGTPITGQTPPAATVVPSAPPAAPAGGASVTGAPITPPVVSGGTTPIAQASQQQTQADFAAQQQQSIQDKREVIIDQFGLRGANPSVGQFFNRPIFGPSINQVADALGPIAAKLDKEDAAVMDAIVQADKLTGGKLVKFTFDGNKIPQSVQKGVEAVLSVANKFQIGHVGSVDEAGQILNTLSQSAKGAELEQINAIHQVLTGKDTEGYIASQTAKTAKPKGKSNAQQQQQLPEQVPAGLGTVPEQGSAGQVDGGLTGLLQPGAVQPVGTGSVAGAAPDQQAGQPSGEGVRPSASVAADNGSDVLTPQVNLTARAPETNELLQQVFKGEPSTTGLVTPVSIGGPVRVAKPKTTGVLNETGTTQGAVGGGQASSQSSQTSQPGVDRQPVQRRKRRAIIGAKEYNPGLQYYASDLSHISSERRVEIIEQLFDAALTPKRQSANVIPAATRGEIARLALNEQFKKEDIAEFTGLGVEAVSKQMQRMGIALKDGKYQVVDPEFAQLLVAKAEAFRSPEFPDGIGISELKGFYSTKYEGEERATGDLAEELETPEPEGDRTKVLAEEMYGGESGEGKSMGTIASAGSSQSAVESEKRNAFAKIEKLQKQLDEASDSDVEGKANLAKQLAAAWAAYEKTQAKRAKEAVATASKTEDETEGEEDAVQVESADEGDVREPTGGGEEVGKANAEPKKPTRTRKAKAESKPAPEAKEEIKAPKEQWDELAAKFPQMPPYATLNKDEKIRWDDVAERGVANLAAANTILSTTVVAAPTETVEAKPAEAVSQINGTDEQKKTAQALADIKAGAVVVWQDGDLALVRAYSTWTGQPVYLAAKGSRITTLDIESFTGKQISPEEKATLVKLKNQFEEQAVEKHATDPFVKFDAAGLAVSQSVSPQLTGVMSGWKQMLGIKANVYVTTIEDAKANKDKFTGPQRAVTSAGFNPNEAGSMRKLPDGSYYVAFTKGTSTAKMLETLAHELGHVHEREAFANADPATQKAIKAEFEKWKASTKGKTAQQLVESLRARAVGRSTTGLEGVAAKDMTQYWTEFTEWYADQVSRWATTSEKPLTVVEKFFARLGAALKKFYYSLKGQKYLPSETMKQFLDKIADGAVIIDNNVGNEKNPFTKSIVQQSVYHATQAKFDTKDMAAGDIGIHFGDMWQAADRGGLRDSNIVFGQYGGNTTNQQVAAKTETMLQSDDIYDRLAREQMGNRRMLKVFINIKNPIKMKEPEGGKWHDPEAVRDALAKAGIVLPVKLDSRITGYTQSAQTRVSGLRMPQTQRDVLNSITEALKAQGYDGIVYQNLFEGSVAERLFGAKVDKTSYIVFDNTQISEPIYDVNYLTKTAGNEFASQAMFVGAKGVETRGMTDKQTTNMVTAKIMDAQGELREDIWYTTGWLRGADNQWRTEFSDRDAKMTLDKVAPGGKVEMNKPYRLGDVLSHLPLYRLYPELAYYTVSFDPALPPRNAAFDPANKSILMSGQQPDDVTTLLHEVQHAIQEVEGFGRGGNPEKMDVLDVNAAEKFYKFSTFRAQTDAQEVAVLKYYRAVQKMHAALVAAKNSLAENNPDKTLQLRTDGLRARIEARTAFDNMLKELGATEKQVQQSMYLLISGEVEARDVEARREYNNELRRQVVPGEGEGLPYDMQLVFDKNTGTYKSIGKTLDTRAQEQVEKLPPKWQPAARTVTTTLMYTLKKAGLASMITEDVINAASKYMKSAQDYLTAQYARQATRLEHELKIDKILQQFDKLPENLKGTGKGSVNEYIHDSTRQGLWGYYPDARLVGTSMAQIDPEFKRRFNAFPDAAQKLIKAVFEQGHDSLAAKQKAVADAIDREYADRIAAVQGDAALTAEIEKEKNLRLAREAKLLGLDSSKPYAYLGRYGDYVVVGKSAEYKFHEEQAKSGPVVKGEYLYGADSRKWLEDNRSNPAHYVVQFAETLAEADQIAAQLNATGDYDIAESFEKEPYSTQGGELFTAVARLRSLYDRESEGADPQAAAAISNLLGDLYLHTVSEASARKSEFQRLNISGADKDMMRNLATRGRADAHFLAALEHNDSISDSLSNMRKERDRNRREAGPYFNELLKRHANSMEYQTPGGLATALQRMSTVWYLSTSPAFYLQQILQTGAISLPYMAGRLGYFRSARAVKRAYGDMATLTKGIGLTDHVDFSQAPADVRDMLKTLVGMGKIDIGIDYDARSRAGDTGVVANVMNKLQGVNNRIETINRATAAIAAYRGYLERYKNNDIAAATKYAADVVSNTHGSYDAFNTPRIMSGPAGKVLLQFKRFQIIQISMLTKLLNTAFKGASAQERTVARHSLAFVAGQMGVLGGVMAVPFAQQAASILSKVFGDPDEPDNWEYKLRQMIGDKAVADLLISGVPAAMGVDISGKVGLGNVFSILPYTDVDLASRSGAEKVLVGLMGPTANLGLKFADGVGLMAQGQYYKGLEQMLPNGVANLMKGTRFAAEGITMRNGDVVLKPDEISMVDAAFQAVGLPTNTITDRQFTQKVVKEFDKYYAERTTEIKGDYVKASRSGDSAAMSDARDEWVKLQESRIANGYKRQPYSELYRAPMEALKRERNTAGGVEFGKSNRRLVESLSTI